MWRDAPRQVLLGVVRAYRLLLSPWLGNGCRFEPTCSAYALQALERNHQRSGSRLQAAAVVDGEAVPGLRQGIDGTGKPRLDIVLALTTTPGETALAAGHGVCQDHAHALIAMARHRCIPARYVSGYLFADAEGESHEASHAWAELWIAGLGWVGFDAANRCCPDARYIRLGSGYDAQDAAPIRGTARGPGTETMDVVVSVVPGPAQSQSQGQEQQ